VIEPFYVQHMNVGTSFPLNIHTGTSGKRGSHPLLYLSFVLLSSKVPGSVMVSPRGVKSDALKVVNLFVATITAHMKSLKEASVNPRTLK
jgi:hypothetical protein